MNSTAKNIILRLRVGVEILCLCLYYIVCACQLSRHYYCAHKVIVHRRSPVQGSRKQCEPHHRYYSLGTGLETEQLTPVSRVHSALRVGSEFNRVCATLFKAHSLRFIYPFADKKLEGERLFCLVVQRFAKS